MIHCKSHDLLAHARAVAALSVRETDERTQAKCMSVIASVGWQIPKPRWGALTFPPNLEICPGCGWRRLQLIRESMSGTEHSKLRISQIIPYWLCLRCWWERAADASATVPVV
jgi:hypothetical protein